RSDRVFLGMHAVDVDSGFTSDFLPEIMTDRAILSIGRQVVVVVDHTKFGRVSSVLVAPVSAANIVVTDTNTSSKYVEKLTDLGVCVLLV
ncbi:MAG: DeoR/GlpR transcriptional regulator, partial [Anaerolineales bacterium]|nr:DeoR/GlpR transcriptional regulator [Anaerolineales bacterium]